MEERKQLRGEKSRLFSLAASRTEGEGFSLDIFTHKLGGKPVCSLAEKLQLKMYDFHLPEEEGTKVSAGLYKHWRLQKQTEGLSLPHLPPAVWETVPLMVGGVWGRIQSHTGQSLQMTLS